jgi:hypothetical protein
MGYFTARQAEGLGFVRNHHSYHVSTGNWTREAHGIYRLAGVPVINPAIEELHRWLLWTMGRKADAPRGAIAYETALIVHGLSDLTLNKVHVTAPKDFRPSVIPDTVVLHRENRDGSEITERDGLRVIRPFLAVLDLLREGRVSIKHIERGLITGPSNRVEALKITQNKSLRVRMRSNIPLFLTSLVTPAVAISTLWRAFFGL